MPSVELRFDRARLGAVRDRAVVVTTEPATFRVDGPGGVDCMQGLLTYDVAKPGDGSMVYGALLTPKGMIVVDAWVLRESGSFTLLVPPRGRDTALEVLRRSLPPRLARVTDLSATDRAAWLVGAHAFEALLRSGLAPLPETCGRVTRLDTTGGALRVALAPEAAPFTAVASGPAPAIDRFTTALLGAGAGIGEAGDLEASRMLRGWPALGAEIDERTLPQEVRYDELGGVSYTKGCYTGQETVARLHFRGHTNRELRGLVWRESAPLADDLVRHGEREVGTVRSVLALDDRRLGLAVMRRDVAPGAQVLAGGQPATVVALPFAPGDVDA
jgi:folate-binding protein YgfZ